MFFKFWYGCLLIVDSFVGGGGVFIGIEMVFGCFLDIVINYNFVVFVFYVVNYLEMLYFFENVYKVDLFDYMWGCYIGFMYFFLDCKYFFKVKGGKLVECNICDFVWIIFGWIECI